jgi:hypothetical protein
MSRKTKTRRGGFLGSLVNNAIVPFSILGLQQSYKKKSRGGKHTRKHRKGNKGKKSRKHR